jgi:hypothetical protein
VLPGRLTNALYGCATLKIPGFTRVLGVFYTLAALLTRSFLVPEFGGPGLLETLRSWLYPSVRPLGRALIGVWLWPAVRPALNGKP